MSEANPRDNARVCVYALLYAALLVCVLTRTPSASAARTGSALCVLLLPDRQVLGLRGQLPDVFTEVEISFYLLRRLLGVKAQEGGKQAKVQKLSKNEILMVNIGSTSTGGKVTAVKHDLAKILLTQPVCTQEGEKIALSRRVDKHWRLIGWGRIRRGVTLELSDAGASGAGAGSSKGDAAGADAE